MAHIDYFNLEGLTVAGNKEISDEEIIKLSEIKIGESVFDAHTNASERKIKKNLYPKFSPSPVHCILSYPYIF